MMKADEIEKEMQCIASFPDEKFIVIIREVGFECDCCGKCCTSEFNDHVFLLDGDAARIFYTGGRCEHYGIRPDICKILPYMLHREPDENGNIEFRQIGGLNEHGLYHSDIDDETCKEIVRQVKKYESDFLGQKLRFLSTIKEHFKKHALRHSQQMYDRMMREYEKGKEIEVYVFIRGKFERERFSKQILTHKTKNIII